MTLVETEPMEAAMPRSLRPVLAVIPAVCYENPTRRGLWYFIRDVILYGAVLFGLFSTDRIYFLIPLWILAALIVGGLFVLETVSVIIQVISFKLTGKRIFKMAPIHHHFEKKGWAESTIVIRFWIIAIILALIGLATLKLR